MHVHLHQLTAAIEVDQTSSTYWREHSQKLKMTAMIAATVLTDGLNIIGYMYNSR